ncbi:MAG: STY4526/YPO1902 family pathogenicity island replication protein [Candidatus Thiodiazotropha taylori]
MGYHTDSNKTDDINLSRAAFEMLFKYHSRGEAESLERLGIDLNLLIRVRGLTSESFHRLLSRMGNFVKFHLDNQVLDMHLQIEEKHMETQEQARRLISKGAPFPMIRELYGWTREAFHFERRLAGLTNLQSRGRPTLPTDDIGERIAQAWYEVIGSDRSTPESAADWLALATVSGTTLSEIWFWYCNELKEITHG